MSRFAARESDHHICPMVTGTVPHVGGPILPKGGSVIIEGKPVALVTEQAQCNGPIDAIIMGSPTVLIDGLNVARLGDPSIHGGQIDTASSTVLIGDAIFGLLEEAFLTDLKEPLTPSQAAMLFFVMAQQKYISFGYPRDGCFARAELMARMMRSVGLSPDKAWTFADMNNGALIRVETSNVPEGYVEWTYHVAPTVQVQSEVGQTQTVVMDPSMFAHPVTLDLWTAAQHNVAVSGTTEYSQSPVPVCSGQTSSGYWPGPDPSQGVENNALQTMEDYKPLEGR